MSATEYDPSGNSNTSFHDRADIINLSFLYDFFKQMIRFNGLRFKV